MNEASIVTKLLRLLQNKWFWIAVAVLVAGILVLKHWTKITGWLGRTFGRDFGDYGNAPISDERQNELKTLARQAYNVIYGIDLTGSWQEVYIKLLALNDAELRFTARHYEQAITRGNSLSHDIDGELKPFTDLDEQLISRLHVLNL